MADRTHDGLLGHDGLLREFCAENLTYVAAALAAGAGRVELCDNLAAGGTTPSAGVIAEAVRIVHGAGAAVRVIIRPRGGDFAYGASELAAMERDIDVALDLGADGVVLGCLERGAAGGWGLDRAVLDRLCARVRSAATRRGAPAGITFHMAFDELAPADQLVCLLDLARAGVDRVLSHGGAAGTPIEGNLPHLARLTARAREAGLELMPGGGVTHRNVADVAAATGARELHGTKIVDLG